ncbi:ABC transporter permease subunit [Melghirimyces profundicolus]|nr:ABC transporter permease subunit [Melghirimyces profundicolus]
MSIFKQELKFHRNSFIIWAVVMVLFVFVYLGSYEAIAMDEQMMKVYEKLPEAMKKAYYMDQVNMADIHGYFVSTFMYLIILMGIYTAISTATVFAKEEDRRTAEFLYTRPVTRTNIFAQKILSNLTGLILMHLMVLGAIFLTLTGIITADYEPAVFVYVVMSTFFVSAAIGAVGWLISTFLTGERLASSFGIGLVLGSYMCHILSGLAEELEPFQYFSLMYYTDLPFIVQNSALPWEKTAIMLLIFVVSGGLAHFRFQSKDIHV